MATAEEQKAWAKERYRALEGCLTIEEALKRVFSRNNMSQSPKEGYEEAYFKTERKIQIIRDMMLEYRHMMEE